MLKPEDNSIQWQLGETVQTCKYTSVKPWLYEWLYSYLRRLLVDVDGKTPCAVKKGRKRKPPCNWVPVALWRYLASGLSPCALYRTLAEKVGTATLLAALSLEFEVSFSSVQLQKAMTTWSTELKLKASTLHFSISAWAPPQKAETTCNHQAHVERPATKGYDDMKQWN